MKLYQRLKAKLFKKEYGKVIDTEEELLLPVTIAKEKAIKAIKHNMIVAEMWNDNSNRKIDINFTYPRNKKNINEIEIGLEDVRASDGIKIHYDFERDGYVVMQSYVVEVSEERCETRWEEVGFFQSWALESKGNLV